MAQPQSDNIRNLNMAGYKAIGQLTNKLTAAAVKSTFQIPLGVDDNKTGTIYMSQFINYLTTALDLSKYLTTDDAYTKSDTYSQEQVNTLLESVPSAEDVYTKNETYAKSETFSQEEVTAAIAGTAIDSYTKAETYSKSEVESLVSTGSTNVYTKNETYSQAESYSQTEVNNLLGLRALATEMYNQTQTDTLLAAKANISDVYSKTESYAQSETYSQTQIDLLLDAKSSTETTYSKDDVDAMIPSVAGLASQSYVDGELESKLSEDEVYLKAQVYTKEDADAEFLTYNKLSTNFYIKSVTKTLTAGSASATFDLVNEFALPSFQQVVRNGAIIQLATVDIPAQDETDVGSLTATVTVTDPAGAFVNGDVVTFNVAVIKVDV